MIVYAPSMTDSEHQSCCCIRILAFRRLQADQYAPIFGATVNKVASPHNLPDDSHHPHYHVQVPYGINRRESELVLGMYV